MKVGIMQPYFFPYLGYWQLLNAVDRFVILDDVNYIMHGYINKNSILVNGKPHSFTISLEKPSQNKLICETKLSFPMEERINLLKTFDMAYHKAPHFQEVFPLLESAILYSEKSIVPFLQNAIFLTTEYLGIETEIILSSELMKDENKKAQDRIIEINKRLGADVYINAIGGKSLYNKKDFIDNGIALFFIQMKPCNYNQFKNSFVPNLSIIDVMMFNGKERIAEMLQEYNLV